MHVGTDFPKLPPVTGQYWSLFQCSMLGTGGTCVGFGFKKASNVDYKLRFRGTFAAIVGCVGCAGVWGCGAMGVTSGDSGDLGDSTATASSLEG